MSEAVFPLLGAAAVFLALLPASALFAKLALALLDRVERGPALHRRSGVRFALLAGSSVLPVAWLVSAALHQAESGRWSAACALPHARDALCWEAAAFALALVVLLGIRLAVRRRRAFRADRSSPRATELRARIARLAVSSPPLAPLATRLEVAERAPVPLATLGWLVPRVWIVPAFAEALDDEALAAALAHELAHVRGLDGLRYALLEAALDLHPLGRLILGPEVARWMFAREAHCDREAVAHGASAMGLAHALVAAARPGATPWAALGGGASVRLRAQLLLAYAERAPEPCCARRELRWLLAPLGAALVLPHVASTSPLDVLHALSEQVALVVLGG